MWTKIIELSHLEIFARNEYGDVLFTIALIALIFAVLVFFRIVFWASAKVLITLFTSVKDTKIALKEQETEQMRIKQSY